MAVSEEDWTMKGCTDKGAVLNMYNKAVDKSSLEGWAARCSESTSVVFSLEMEERINFVWQGNKGKAKRRREKGLLEVDFTGWNL